MRIELIVFFLALAVFLFFQIARNLKAKNNQTETQSQKTQEVKKEKKRKLSVGWIVTVAVLALIIYSGYNYYAKKDFTPQPSARVATQEKKIEVIVDKDYGKIEVPLPYYHWFDLVSDKDFGVELADGREFIFKTGERHPYLGDEIPANRLGLKSFDGITKIKIFLRPKIRA